MPGTISTTTYNEEQAQHTGDAAAIATSGPFTPLVNDIEAALGSARPRLLRLASLHGIAPDAAEDVAQETLVEAWRHLDQMHTPIRFDAWLTTLLDHALSYLSANLRTAEYMRILTSTPSPDATPAEMATLLATAANGAPTIQVYREGTLAVALGLLDVRQA